MKTIQPLSLTGTILSKGEIIVKDKYSIQNIVFVSDGCSSEDAFPMLAMNKNTSHLLYVEKGDRVRVFFQIYGRKSDLKYSRYANLSIHKVEKLEQLSKDNFNVGRSRDAYIPEKNKNTPT